MNKWLYAITILLMTSGSLITNAAETAASSSNSAQTSDSASNPANLFPPKMQDFPLYGDLPIPNSKPTTEEETGTGTGWIQKVSQPYIQVYLPAKIKATGASVVIFPGGAYWGLTFEHEGVQQANYFVDQGIAAFVVKYRLPSDAWMKDKSIGPLQDAQQAMKFVRERATGVNALLNGTSIPTESV